MSDTPVLTAPRDGVITANIAETILSRMLNYSAAVLSDRALPDARDGLKPVARHLLYSAHEMGLRSTSKYRKSAALVGDTMGKYHPHGDSSLYGAAVYMAQPWVKLHPIFDGQGNYGSIDGDSAAAMRYTEIRLSRAGEAFLNGLDENAVDFKPNYDQTLKVPTVLPVSYPALLVHGVVGIAVGYASNLPTHNLRECMAAASLLLENPDAGTDDVLNCLPAPDLPTGGVMYDTHQYRKVIETGRGSIRLRATYTVEQTGKREILVLTALPYHSRLNKATVLQNLTEAIDSGSYPDIVEITDESSNMDVRIVIKLKQGADAEAVFSQLLSIPNALDVSLTCNLNVLHKGIPTQMGLSSALKVFNEHYENVMVRKAEFRRNKHLARVHIIDGLLLVLDRLDEAIKIIRASENAKAAGKNLMAAFGLSEAQTAAVLAMRLSSLNALEVTELVEERRDLVEVKIAYLNKLLEDRTFRVSEILKEYAATAKTLGRDRVCRVDNTLGQIKKADYITQEQAVIHLTKDGYIKRMPASAFRRQKRNTQGRSAILLNPGDAVANVFEGNTHDVLMTVTAQGQAHALQVWDIPEGDANHKGRHLNNLMPQLAGKDIAAVLFTPGFENKDAILVMATQQGKIKSSPLSVYSGSLRVTGVAAIKLNEGDRVVSARLSMNEKDDVIMVSDDGYLTRFNRKENLSIQGRVSAGIGGMRLNEGAKVMSMDIVPESQRAESAILTLGDKGVGKYSAVEDYRLCNRNTRGVAAMRTGEDIKVGKLAFALVIRPQEQDVLLCTTRKINRLSLASMTPAGRTTMGSSLIKLADDDRLLNVLPTEREQDAVEPTNETDPA